MQLPEAEWKQFFDIWIRLLAYVNDTYHVSPDYGHPKTSQETTTETVLPIRNKLWEDVSIIDKYIDSTVGITTDEINILRIWKNRIKGKFFIMRHLKKYTVLFDTEGGRLFGVLGLRHSLIAYYPDNVLPVMVEAVLLPFKDKIIYDSLMEPYSFHFGKNMRDSLNEEYQQLKKEKGIIARYVLNGEK
jgi:hypothetical protein